jgi:phosphotransacetylase
LVLVFPDRTSANARYKLLTRIGRAETIGSILIGRSKTVRVLQSGTEI